MEKRRCQLVAGVRRRHCDSGQLPPLYAPSFFILDHAFRGGTERAGRT